MNTRILYCFVLILVPRLLTNSVSTTLSIITCRRLLYYIVVFVVYFLPYIVVTLFFFPCRRYFISSLIPSPISSLHISSFVNPLYEHSRHHFVTLIVDISSPFIIVFLALSSTLKATTSHLGGSGCYGRCSCLPYPSLSVAFKPIIVAKYIFSSDITRARGLVPRSTFFNCLYIQGEML